MEEAPNYELLLKKFKKKPLFQVGELSHQVEFGRAEVEELIPHRDPFLLVDSISGFDATHQRILAHRHIAEDDPVFKGHFPGYPVYPGTLQLEMLGQLGTALCALLEEPIGAVGIARKQTIVRATKVLGAIFLEPLLPGQTVTLLGDRLEWDGSIARFVGQVIHNGVVCTIAAGELWVLL